MTISLKLHPCFFDFLGTFLWNFHFSSLAGKSLDKSRLVLPNAMLILNQVYGRAKLHGIYRYLTGTSRKDLPFA